MGGKLSRNSKAAEQEALESGLYFADHEGNVFSNWFDPPKKIKLQPKGNGYLKFNACMPNGNRVVNAHRFIWWCTYGKIPAKLNINHKNFDRTDNRLSNLELISFADNVRYSAKNGRFKNNGKHIKGEGNPKAVLSEKQVKHIYKRLLKGETVAVLCKKYKVGRTAIRDIKSQKSWKHLWVN